MCCRVRDHSAEEMRVIHLVRDPRAVALSRAEMHNFTGNVVKEMKKNCEFDLSVYKEYELRSKMSLPIWTADNYIAVRFVFLNNCTAFHLITVCNTTLLIRQIRSIFKVFCFPTFEKLKVCHFVRTTKLYYINVVILT